MVIKNYFVDSLQKLQNHFQTSWYYVRYVVNVKMDKQIENSATCELRSLIHFLNVRNTILADMHRQGSEDYGKNATSDSMVI